MISRRYSKLFANERGAAVIEMALVAPVLALGVIGVVDMSNAYSKKLASGAGCTTRHREDRSDDEKARLSKRRWRTKPFVRSTVSIRTAPAKRAPITSSDVTVTWRLECTEFNGTITCSIEHDFRRPMTPLSAGLEPELGGLRASHRYR